MKALGLIVTFGVLWTSAAQASLFFDDFSTDTRAQYVEYSTQGGHGSHYTLPGGPYEATSHTWTIVDGALNYDRWDAGWTESFLVHDTFRLPAQAVVRTMFQFDC